MKVKKSKLGSWIFLHLSSEAKYNLIIFHVDKPFLMDYTYKYLNLVPSTMSNFMNSRACNVRWNQVKKQTLKPSVSNVAKFGVKHQFVVYVKEEKAILTAAEGFSVWSGIQNSEFRIGMTWPWSAI